MLTPLSKNYLGLYYPKDDHPTKARAVPALSQCNRAHILTSYFSNNFNIIFPCKHRYTMLSTPKEPSDQNVLSVLTVIHERAIRPAHLITFNLIFKTILSELCKLRI
jgi:hypothetical protein